MCNINIVLWKLLIKKKENNDLFFTWTVKDELVIETEILDWKEGIWTLTLGEETIEDATICKLQLSKLIVQGLLILRDPFTVFEVAIVAVREIPN